MLKLTSVKLLDNLYKKFKISNLDDNFTLQKLINRSMDLYVHNDDFRKQGKGIHVINHLIDEAKKLKIKRLSIETGAGDFFLPARKLFEKTGFTVCEPFAHYKKDINSVYLTMLIDDI